MALRENAVTSLSFYAALITLALQTKYPASLPLEKYRRVQQTSVVDAENRIYKFLLHIKCCVKYREAYGKQRRMCFIDCDIRTRYASTRRIEVRDIWTLTRYINRMTDAFKPTHLRSCDV
eukprot:7429827-Pyramimonas_sp.AAC.1